VVRIYSKLIVCFMLFTCLFGFSFVLSEGSAGGFQVLYSEDMKTLMYFQNDNGPYDLIVPEGVIRIDDDALLQGCIEKIQLPSTIEEFLKAIRNNPLLSEICVDEENENYISIDGVLFSSDKEVLLLYPSSKKGSEYRIPDGTCYIADEAFAFAKELSTLFVPESVKRIGDYSFYCARQLTEIVGGQSLVSIGNGAFLGCSSFRKFELPDSLCDIGQQSFCETAFEEINITDLVTDIPSDAFGCCENLMKIHIGSNVISISEDAFRGIDGSQIVVNTCSGSMAESFAQRNGLAVDYYDSMEDALIVK